MNLQEISFTKYISRFRKGGFALLDQGCFAGTHFLMNILLARWLSSAEYGAFALTYSSFLFLSGFHNALLLEPMSVLGPADHKDHLKKYLASLFWIHWGVTFTLALVLGIGVSILFMIGNHSYWVSGFVALMIAAPCILLFWFSRRVCYLKLQPQMAFSGSLIYSLLLLGSLLLLKRFNLISLSGAFISMSTVSIAASCFLLHRIGLLSKQSLVTTNFSFKPILAENWKYGKWVAATTIVFWVATHGYYVLTTGILGLEKTGALKAFQNCISPVKRIFTSFSLLLLPWSSKRLVNEGIETLKSDIQKIALLLTLIAIIYFSVIWSLRISIINLLYGGKYSEYTWLLMYLLLVPVIQAMAGGWHIGLKAMQTPRAVFMGNFVASCVTLSMGILLIYIWGLLGVGVGHIVTEITIAGVIGWYYRRLVNEKTPK